MKLFLMLLILVPLFGCVKEAGKVPTAAATGDGEDTTPTPTPTGPDPLATYAWHLNNTGQTTFSDSAGVPGVDISHAAALLQGFTGDGVKVAVSDTGTDWDHPDLEANGMLTQHRNYASSRSTNWRGSLPSPTGHDAHGTATTGIIAAVKDNLIGSHGVAPEASFGAFKFVIPYASSVTAASIVARTVDQTDGDFDIFNYSYGYGDCVFYEESRLVLEAIEDGITNLRNGKGALYIQSAGNGYQNYLVYCLGIGGTDTYSHNPNFSDEMATPYKILVGAVNAIGRSSSYSSNGSAIWVSAPGGEFGTDEPAILTTDIASCGQGYARTASDTDFNIGALALNSACDYTNTMNGTSSAAPMVSGVAALMLEAEPNLTWRDVKHILASTADQIDPVNSVLPQPLGLELTGYDYDYKWNQNAAGYFFSNMYGFGMVNADAAVNMAKNYSFPLGTYETTQNPNYTNWYYRSGTVSRAIPDADPAGSAPSSITVNHNFFIEAVQIRVNLTHDSPKDLAIQLKSPSSTYQARLLNINSGVYALAWPEDKLLITNAFYGEESLGDWELTVVDGTTGNAGMLDNWSILIHGHRIDGVGANPSAPTGVSVISPYPDTTISTTTTFTPSVSTDVIRYEVSVGTTSGATNVAKWYSIGLETSFNVINLNLTDNRTYYVNIRAVDDQENTSSVVTRAWYVDTDF